MEFNNIPGYNLHDLNRTGGNMKKIRKIFAGLLFVLYLASAGCPAGSKILNIPMKTYSGTEIPDGEYLHYVMYFGGERDSDYYYVTRRETGIGRQ